MVNIIKVIMIKKIKVLEYNYDRFTYNFIVELSKYYNIQYADTIQNY